MIYLLAPLVAKNRSLWLFSGVLCTGNVGGVGVEFRGRDGGEGGSADLKSTLCRGVVVLTVIR